MTLILTIAVYIILIELVLRLPLMKTVSKIRGVAGRALHTMLAGTVSDHWKEKVMLVYARSLFSSSVKLAALLTAIGAVAFLLVFIVSSLGFAVDDFITSAAGLLFSFAVTVIYLRIRKLLV